MNNIITILLLNRIKIVNIYLNLNLKVFFLFIFEFGKNISLDTHAPSGIMAFSVIAAKILGRALMSKRPHGLPSFWSFAAWFSKLKT